MTDLANIRLTYTPNLSDTFAVARYGQRYFYSARQRHVWWLVPGLQVLVLAAVIIWDRPIKDMLAPFLDPLVNVWTPVLFFVLISLALWLVLCRWLAPRMSARWLTQRNAPKPIIFEVQPDRLHWQDDDSGHWVKWAAIEQVLVTPTSVCCPATPKMYFVPRSAFRDGAELEAFVRSALEHLTEAAKQASLADRSVAAILDRRT